MFLGGKGRLVMGLSFLSFAIKLVTSVYFLALFLARY